MVSLNQGLHRLCLGRAMEVAEVSFQRELDPTSVPFRFSLRIRVGWIQFSRLGLLVIGQKWPALLTQESVT